METPPERCSKLANFLRKLSGDWHLLKDVPLSETEIQKLIFEGSLPVFHYYILLVAATAISTIGLLTNSAATIIGGMLIAPLMAPLMSLGFSTISFQRALVRRSLFAAGTGLVLVVIISYLFTSLLGLRLVDSEILSRTRPNLLDLAVAVAAGAVGAFAYARPRIANAVPGVAIAVALVPPLCVVGIALASGSVGEDLVQRGGQHQNMAAGAFLLFAANVIGILFSAAVVFLLHGYGQIRKGAIGMSILVIGLFLLVWPLDYSYRNLYADAAIHRVIEEMKMGRSSPFDGRSELISLNVMYQNDRYDLRIVVMVPAEDLPSFREKIGVLSKRLEERLGSPVHVEARVLPATYFNSVPGS